MEVGYGQKVCGQFVDPSGGPEALAFRAVTVTTGVIKDPYMAALITFIDVSSQESGPSVFKGIKYFHLPG